MALIFFVFVKKLFYKIHATASKTGWKVGNNDSTVHFWKLLRYFKFSPIFRSQISYRKYLKLIYFRFIHRKVIKVCPFARAIMRRYFMSEFLMTLWTANVKTYLVKYVEKYWETGLFAKTRHRRQRKWRTANFAKAQV